MNEKLVQDIVEKFGLTQEEVVNEYKRIEDETRAMFTFITNTEELTKRVDNNVATFFRNAAKSDVITFEGVVLAIEPPQNINQRRLNKAMQAYNENPEACLWKDNLQLGQEQGFIKILLNEPVAVDNNEFWNKGQPNQRKNPNYGRPFNVDEYQRHVYGVTTYNNEVTKFKFNIVYNDVDILTKLKIIKEMKVPLNKPVSFKVAINKRLNDGTLHLVRRKITRFNVIEGRIEPDGQPLQVDIIDLITQSYQLTPIKALEEVVSFNRENKIYGDLRLIKGQVIDLNLVPQSGKPSFRLMEESLDLSETTDVRVSLNDELTENVDFGEFSTVMVLGNPWVLIDNNTGNKLVGMTAYGVYALEKSLPPNIKPIQESDEEFAEFREQAKSLQQEQSVQLDFHELGTPTTDGSK